MIFFILNVLTIPTIVQVLINIARKCNFAILRSLNNSCPKVSIRNIIKIVHPDCDAVKIPALKWRSAFSMHSNQHGDLILAISSPREHRTSRSPLEPQGTQYICKSYNAADTIWLIQCCWTRLMKGTRFSGVVLPISIIRVVLCQGI